MTNQNDDTNEIARLNNHAQFYLRTLQRFALQTRLDALEKIHEEMKHFLETAEPSGCFRAEESKRLRQIDADFDDSSLLGELMYFMEVEGISVRSSDAREPVRVLEAKVEQVFDELPLSTKWAFYLTTRTADFYSDESVLNALLVYAQEKDEFRFSNELEIEESKLKNMYWITQDITQEVIDSLSKYPWGRSERYTSMRELD